MMRPFHVAAENGHWQILSLLLEARADHEGLCKWLCILQPPLRRQTLPTHIPEDLA